ncbi:MAG: alkaline phosphatase family protein [Rhodoglobus sp.]
MLPGSKPQGLSLADVLQSSLHALAGRPNRFGLAPVRNAVVILVDGLGSQALVARAGHARTLAGAMSASSVIDSGFPTTTACALTTLTTGVTPGEHGLVGYSVLDTEHDRVVNQLTGWDDRLDPATWQRVPTLFETATIEGVDSLAIGPSRYRDSGFTQAVLRGARYVTAASIRDRMLAAAAQIADPGPPKLVYVYIPELDQAAHAFGCQSGEWTAALEDTDSALRALCLAAGPRDGVLVTADHGVIDIAHDAHVLVEGTLLDAVRFMAGEPRCLQLHIEPDASERQRSAVMDRWRAAEADRSWVVTKREAITAGWFGPVHPEVFPRIGDVLVAARKNIAYYDARIHEPKGRMMVAQHGSWSPAELRVPVLKFGAFSAR